MREKQRWLGELKFKYAWRRVRVAYQIHPCVERCCKRNGTKCAFRGAQLIELRHARTDMFGGKQCACRTLATTQQCALANCVAKAAIKKDKCRLAIGVYAVEVWLHYDAAFALN